MLLTRPVLDRIVAGETDLVFRLWRRPTVKTGGRLRTVVGELSIDDVSLVDPDDLDDDSARRAGFSDVTTLRASLAPRPASTRSRVARPDESSRLYRIRVSYAGADPRAGLRETLLTRTELARLADRLRAMDSRAADGEWVQPTLALIKRWPERRAPELAEMAGSDTAPWKARVRRLKELGLTESLPVGYRLSPRGEQVLRKLRRTQDGGGSARSR